MAKTPDTLHADIERRFPDNDEALITPLGTRSMLHDLVDADQRGPNYRPSGPLSVIYLTQAEAERTGRPYATLEGLDSRYFYNGMECRVDLHPEGFGVVLQLVYDNRANPREGLLGFIDGTLQLYPQAQVNGKNPLKWVRKDSPEALTANVALYDEEYNATGSPAGYKQNDLVRWEFFNAQGRYYVTFQARENGRLPEPTSPEGDEFWLVFNPAPTPYQAWQSLSPDELRKLAAERKLSPGRLYIVSPRMMPGSESDQQYPDLFIRALLESVLEPTGYLLEPTGERPLVNYDLATDTTSPLQVGGGASSFAELEGDPRSNVALAQLLDTLPAGTKSVTYDQLMRLLASRTPRSGDPFLITDFRTTHYLPNTDNVLWTGPIEPLLVYATGPGSLAPIAYSPRYPQDIIHYSPLNLNYVPGSKYGHITRRYDTLHGNDLPLDFRGVKFRRWLKTLPQPDSKGNTTSYVSDTPTGNNFIDIGMFELYEKCRNNVWTGYERVVLGSSADVSIFKYINFTSDSSSRILNSKLDNSKFFGALAGGSWCRGLRLINSALTGIDGSYYDEYNFFGGTFIDSSVTNKLLIGREEGSTVIRSVLGNVLLSNKFYVGGAEYVAGGAVGGGGPVDETKLAHLAGTETFTGLKTFAENTVAKKDFNAEAYSIGSQQLATYQSLGVGNGYYITLFNGQNYVELQGYRVKIYTAEFTFEAGGTGRRVRFQNQGNVLADGDLESLASSAGLIQTDRVTGTRYRLRIDNGALSLEPA